MYSKLFRRVIFPLMEIAEGTKIQKYLKLLDKTQWWKPEELEELQNKKLRALIKHAYENVPYYHQLFRKLNLKAEDVRTREDLQKLPFLTKEIIRRNLTRFLAKNIPESQLMETHSSGSTGEPLKYYIDKESYSHGWAQTFRCWSWAGYRLGEPYTKISLNPRKQLIKKIQDKLLNCKYVYSSNINKNNLKDFLSMMKGSSIIRSYASSIFMIANMIENYGVESKWIPYPKAIATTGETLFENWRNKIEEVFECQILDGYGGESTPIAFECLEHAGYHICSEHVIPEIVRNESVASPGEIGEVVVTNLDRWAMPLIRYNIKDIAIMGKEECSCGRGLPLLDSIEGRDTEIVITPNGNFLVVHFFTILFEYIEGVDQFQVIQEKIDELNIKIVKNDKFTEKDKNYIFSEIKKHAGDEININLEFTDSIPPTRSGKRRFVISKVPMDVLWRRIE